MEGTGSARPGYARRTTLIAGQPLTIDSPELYRGPRVRVLSVECPDCNHQSTALQPRRDRTPVPCVVPVRWLRWADKTCVCGAPVLIEMESV